MIIVSQNDSERSRHAFATTEKELHWPDVPSDNCQHCNDHNAIISRKMPRSPHGEYAFEKISNQSQHESLPAHEPANIFRADTSAADFTDVLARAHLYQVVTRRKTTEQIRPQPN